MKLKVIVVGLIVAAILAFTVFGDRGLLNLYQYKRESQQLSRETKRLQEENQRLRDEIDRLNNDPSYIERLAREELGMIKSGEIVLQFTEESSPTPP